MAQKKATAPTEKETQIEGAGVEKEKGNRSKFGDDQVITLLVDHNPKRPKSASFARFENYEDEMTVKGALAAGITTGDLNWDTEHGFIEIGDEYNEDAVKKSKAVKEKKAAAEKVPADAKEAKVGGKKGK